MVTPVGPPANRRPSTIVIVVAVLGALLFVVAVISEAVFHTSIDPTETFFAVTLHNDTTSAVVVKQCDNDCNSFDERDRLEPGANVRVNTSSDNVANWWSVTDTSGATLGCLPLRFGHKVDGLVVNISQRTGCPAHASPSIMSSVVGTILGLALALFAASVGLASVVLATIAVYRWARHRGFSDGRVTAFTVVGGFAMFLGGWLVFDVYVVVRQAARLIRPPGPAAL